MFLYSIYKILIYYLTLFFFGAFALTASLGSLLCGWLPATDQVQRGFQRIFHWNFALFVEWCVCSGIMRIRFRGFDDLPRGGSVLAANHPSLLDVTCLLARLPEAVCVFKPAIRRNPLLGAGARRAGYLASDGGHDGIRAAAEKVAAGHTLIIFPEGTRTPAGENLLPLKPGFVLIARRARAPIQLVRITTDSDALTKSLAWWRPPHLPAQIEISAGPRFVIEAEENIDAVSTRIEAWFRSTPDLGKIAALTAAAS